MLNVVLDHKMDSTVKVLYFRPAAEKMDDVEGIKGNYFSDLKCMVGIHLKMENTYISPGKVNLL
jgi:hypothetical protein